ncbi:MAG: rhodanese-like domain-containing protein [Lentilitoribacter sp.]
MSLILIAFPVRADTPLMSAPQAFEKLSAGDLVVLDIRSREEWQDSGVAQGALPISMHEKDFLERFQSVLLEYEPEKIALICATGGRSAEATYFLEQNGLTGVADVSEGMFGNRNVPGWIKHGLPLFRLAKRWQIMKDFKVLGKNNAMLEVSPKPVIS